MGQLRMEVSIVKESALGVALLRERAGHSRARRLKSLAADALAMETTQPLETTFLPILSEMRDAIAALGRELATLKLAAMTPQASDVKRGPAAFLAAPEDFEIPPSSEPLPADMFKQFN